MKKFLVLSSWSAAIGSMLITAFAVVGCDDSSSASAGPNDEPGVESSSSIERGSSSSGSVDPISSSSFQGDKLSSCSGENETSSSSVNSNSSSSVIPGADEESSSNKTPEPAEGSSSSEMSELSSNSSLGFDWNLPKEAYFNSEIEYDSIVDSRDGKIYKTVKIGDQVWMAENLNYDDSVATPSLIGKSWCYENETKNCKVVGRLYTWSAAIDSAKLYTDNSIDCGYGKTTCGLSGIVQGICPAGWHLPCNDEWSALIKTVGGLIVNFKSQSGWYSDKNGTDAFGYTALPAGIRDNYGYFEIGSTNFWSSTEYGSSTVYRSRFESYYMSLGYETAWVTYGYNNYGISVRCVKD